MNYQSRSPFWNTGAKLGFLLVLAGVMTVGALGFSAVTATATGVSHPLYGERHGKEYRAECGSVFRPADVGNDPETEFFDEDASVECGKALGSRRFLVDTVGGGVVLLGLLTILVFVVGDLPLGRLGPEAKESTKPGSTRSSDRSPKDPRDHSPRVGSDGDPFAVRPADRRAEHPPSGATAELLAPLERLQRLKEAGSLTDSEFETLKAAALDRRD